MRLPVCFHYDNAFTNNLYYNVPDIFGHVFYCNTAKMVDLNEILTSAIALKWYNLKNKSIPLQSAS